MWEKVMNEQLSKIEEKLDKVEEKISNIDVTLAKQAKDLEHHIYRTDLAESNIELLRTEMQPVKKHVALMDASLKVIGAIASVITFILGIVKIFL
jgi:predicted  nucleic acid-binding Zn-ribbon protein